MKPGTPKTLKLSTPIVMGEGEEPITVLAFRELEAGDMRGLTLNQITEGDVDTILAVASRLTGQIVPTLRKLKAADFVEVVQIIAGFLVPSRSAGKEA